MKFNERKLYYEQGASEVMNRIAQLKANSKATA